jgi:hypothetical protein
MSETDLDVVDDTAADEQEQFTSQFGWFHFFKTVIKDGTWAKMSLAAKAVYPVIKSYANSKTGAAFPSLDTLVKMSGTSTPSVLKALKELAELKMIALAEKKKPGKPCVYSLIETFDVKHPVTGEMKAATTSYIPDQMKKVMDELKVYAKTGVEGSAIHLTIVNIVNSTTGDVTTSGIVVNNNSPQNPQELGYDHERLIRGTNDRFEGRITDDSRYADEINEAQGKDDRDR